MMSKRIPLALVSLLFISCASNKYTGNIMHQGNDGKYVHQIGVTGKKFEKDSDPFFEQAIKTINSKDTIALLGMYSKSFREGYDDSTSSNIFKITSALINEYTTEGQLSLISIAPISSYDDAAAKNPYEYWDYITAIYSNNSRTRCLKIGAEKTTSGLAIMSLILLNCNDGTTINGSTRPKKFQK